MKISSARYSGSGSGSYRKIRSDSMVLNIEIRYVPPQHHDDKINSWYSNIFIIFLACLTLCNLLVVSSNRLDPTKLQNSH
jgi:hypothetical protein